MRISDLRHLNKTSEKLQDIIMMIKRIKESMGDKTQCHMKISPNGGRLSSVDIAVRVMNDDIRFQLYTELLKILEEKDIELRYILSKAGVDL